VRIGLHTAEANRRGADYSGKGVHIAARVSALAVGGQILATSQALAEARDFRVGDVRLVTVRGVSDPVSLASVVWD
jgi:class 3 adenylate cyclase